jgi:hypothetical protein
MVRAAVLLKGFMYMNPFMKIPPGICTGSQQLENRITGGRRHLLAP